MRIPPWLQRRRRIDLDEDDFTEEIRAHLAIAEQERVAEGTDPVEARYAALREFGNVTRTTEATRLVWTPHWLEMLRDVLSDVRYALRALGKHPGFSLTVIAVLALGIGLNATVFTMLKAALFTPIAGVEGSGRLAVVFAETNTGRAVRLSYPDYRSLRENNDAFADLFGSVVARANLGRGRGARQVWGELVTGNYFSVLGVRAQTGRTLLASDEIAPGRHPVVVISDLLWRRHFSADPAIVGKTIEVNNALLTVVGVADPTFHGTTVVYDVELFIPIMMAPTLGFTFGSQHTTPSEILVDRRAAMLYPQGYLRAGTSLREASQRMAPLWNVLSADRPIGEAADRIRVAAFWETPNGAPSYILPTLTVLTMMGLLVLLIACANIAGLVVVRGLSRRGEIAVRLALGAARGRIVRLLIVENLVLAIPGGLLGVIVAGYSISYLAEYAQWLAVPDRVFFNVGVDRLVLAFAALTACAGTLVFGFVPALHTSRVDLVTVINENASPRGSARGRFRSVLVVGQVAVSLMLLVAAGLVTRSLDAARRTYPGFDWNDVVGVGLDLKQNGYDRARGPIFYRRLLDDVRADPAVESATLAAYQPLAMQDTRTSRIAIDGYEPASGEDLAFMSNTVASDYFRTLRIPVVAGRAFDEGDDQTGAPVVMVNHTFAQRFWRGAVEAIGKRVRVENGEWRTIVGVAADVKYARIDEAPRPYFYVPLFQAYRSGMILHARRASGGTDALEALVRTSREHVARLDADLPIMYARPMAGQLRGALIFMNLTATMLFVFGGAGMALAAMGTYGLVSYTVRQRAHEIGIRITLGASSGSVVRQFLTRGLTLGAAGALLGTLAALGTGQTLRTVLFGVSPTDAVSFVQALLIVLGAVAVATIVPAWRAARTDALSALRHQ